jgi:flagellar hook-length control protein FliK
LITRLNKTDKSVEATVTHSDTSKQKGFEFTKQNQGHHNLAVTTKTHTSASVEKVSDLLNLPEMKSPESIRTSDAADRQENVDRIVRAARTALTRGASRIQIRLEPPELGTLRIEIKQSSNGLNMQLQATNLKAQQVLQQTSNELRAALEAQGLQPRQIDVQLRLDLRDDPAPNQQQNHNPSSQSGSQGQSQNQTQQDFHSEPFLLWQDWQADQESEQAESQFAPTPLWQSLDFNVLDVRV